MENDTQKIGVVLMTYGSATTAEHVAEYFEKIYKGRASAELIKDFENRYRLVGHSPLIEITLAQAALLEKRLNGDDGGADAKRYVVRAGMRHSAPTIDSAVAECRAAGATRLTGIVLSPQFSSIIMEGYRTAFFDAANAAIVAGPWPTESHFIELLARRVQTSLTALEKKYGAGVPVPVIFTTHSLPESVVARDPGYLDQLAATIDAVRAKLDEGEPAATGAALEWYAGYQSAGHTPEAWLKPDLTDLLAKLAAEKKPAVLIVPIQFLADHLEILYDLDIAARKQCEEYGIAYNRIELPNTDPLFIEALAAITKRQL